VLTDAVLLDISQAQRQIDQLETELRRLSQPVRVPVDIDVDQGIDELRRDVQGADAGFGDLNSELAETDRELDRIRGSADRAGRELEQTGRRGVSSFNGMAVAAGAFGVALAAAVGIRAFAGFANEAIQAASNLAESTSKANVVFGEFSGKIQKFAQSAPQALGLANQQALEFTATFGNLFLALGLSQEAAADLSPEIVQLGVDLASFNNITDPTEVLEKLRSGLVGEAEPLRVFGVNINEALTKAKALELGLVGVNGEITEAAKVQARYALILEQTTTAQGDFARTSEGLAGTQKSVNALWEDAKVAIGEALLPAYQQLLDILPGLIAQVTDLAPSFAALGVSLAQAAEDSAPFLSFLLDVGRALPGVASAFANIFSGDVLQAIDDLSVARLQTGFINDLREGVDPALALANALAELNRQTQSRPEDFKKFSEQFIAIANLDPKRAAELGQQLRRTGVDAGFSAPQVQELREQLSLLVTESEGFSRRTPGGSNLPGTDPEDAIAISNTAQAILDLSLAGQSLEAFAPDFESINFDQLTTDLAQSAEGLSNAFSDALADEEGEVASDAKGFVDRVIENIKAEAAFQGNIARLRAAGADMTAAFFEGLGAEQGAETLAGLVNDPAQVARLEEAADQVGRDAAVNTTNSFKQALEEESFDTLNLPPIAVPAFLDFGPLPTFTGIREVGVPVTGGGDVNITFMDTPQPTTATTRITQSLTKIKGNQ
jgi:hypothetical protein